MSGITTLCFSASYAVVLALEFSRMFFRSGVRGAVMVLFAAAGFAAQTVFLMNRAVENSSRPLSSPRDWLLVSSWLLVVAYLYEISRQPRAVIGVFVLPVVMLLIGAAGMAGDEPFDQSTASSVWAIVHSVFLLLGTVAVSIGFVAGVMYLVQANQLKHKTPSPGRIRLPSLEWLERINARTIPISTLLMTGGLLTGVLLNAIYGRLSWYDPAILSLAAMLGWLVAASIFNLVYRPARQGRKVAYLTIAGFVFLVLMFVIVLAGDSDHVMSPSNVAAGLNAIGERALLEAASGPPQGVGA